MEGEWGVEVNKDVKCNVKLSTHYYYYCISVYYYETVSVSVWIWIYKEKKIKNWFRVTRPTLFFPADPKTVYSFLGGGGK